MKANEMKIGFYYYWEAEGKDYLMQVRKDDFKNDNHLNFKTIPLTEEWLVNFGFKHTGNGFYDLIGEHISLCNIGNEFFNAGYKNVSIIKIYHVHELQNLYFALTGEELTLKKQFKS